MQKVAVKEYFRVPIYHPYVVGMATVSPRNALHPSEKAWSTADSMDKLRGHWLQTLEMLDDSSPS